MAEMCVFQKSFLTRLAIPLAALSAALFAVVLCQSSEAADPSLSPGASAAASTSSASEDLIVEFALAPNGGKQDHYQVALQNSDPHSVELTAGLFSVVSAEKQRVEPGLIKKLHARVSLLDGSQQMIAAQTLYDLDLPTAAKTVDFKYYMNHAVGPFSVAVDQLDFDLSPRAKNSKDKIKWSVSGVMKIASERNDVPMSVTLATDGGETPHSALQLQSTEGESSGQDLLVDIVRSLIHPGRRPSSVLDSETSQHIPDADKNGRRSGAPSAQGPQNLQSSPGL
jgi:hypothetical protein